MPTARSCLTALSALLLATLAIPACGNGAGTTEEAPVTLADPTLVDRFESDLEGFEGFLAYPSRIAADADGNLYVVDSKDTRVVVLDRELRAVRVIGRQGEGPGEFGSLRNSMDSPVIAIRGGMLAVLDGANRLSLFTTDGVFRSRFTVPPGTTDIDLMPSEDIVVVTRNGEHLVREYGPDGQLVRAYGQHFLRTDLLEARRWLFNRCRVMALPDGRIATFGLSWPRLRIYEDGELLAESRLDMRCLLPGLEGLEDAEKLQQSFADIAADFEEHPPEAVNRALESGTYTAEHPGFPGTGLILQFEQRDGSIWLQTWGLLFEITEHAHVVRIVRSSRGRHFPNSMTFVGERLYFVHPDSGQIGFMPAAGPGE
ncbi:hypothetical protein ACFL4Y_03570 [Gemmatimonadota bacterium]